MTAQHDAWKRYQRAREDYEDTPMPRDRTEVHAAFCAWCPLFCLRDDVPADMLRDFQDRLDQSDAFATTMAEAMTS
jgi:hypothetical protein